MKDPIAPTSVQPPVDQARRKLTKAGLAVPAVLGTLASKPVLAAVPWKCTISGQVSGNVSGHESESCSSLGRTHSQLTSDYSASPQNAQKLSDLFSGLTVYFHWNDTSLTTTSGDPEATIHQILANVAPASLLYAQKAVVLLLNAKSITDAALYPITESQARNLFIAAATNGNYVETSPAVNWNNTQVKYYIDQLYH